MSGNRGAVDEDVNHAEQRRHLIATGKSIAGAFKLTDREAK
jgi:hypothetical protein